MDKKFSTYLAETGEVGFVRRALSSLVYAEGLPSVRPYERIMFENGAFGYVNAFTEDLVEIISFSHIPPNAGMRVARTGELLKVPVGEELLGSLVNPLGHLLRSDYTGKIVSSFRSIDSEPPPIRGRARITKSCTTGIMITDLMVPLGNGQRTLIIGDQKSGKTSFILRALISQIREGSVGIYVSVGKSKIVLKHIEDSLRAAGVFDRVVIVAAYAEEPAGILYIAPYAGMAIAEYFRDAGDNVMMVIDDLSVHAKMYRELSLLGRRAPGRNSYPGDMFFVHARLMERAGNFKTSHGERSITLLPVIEAAHGDITGYISTNALSMTDGHIFFDYNLYIAGQRPAINPYLSVTRVGKQTQSEISKKINQHLTSFLSTARRLEAITSFGAELSDQIKETLEKQKHVLTAFNQQAEEIIAPPLQIYLFALAWSGSWKGKSGEDVEKDIRTHKQRYSSDTEFRNVIEAVVSKSSTLDNLLQNLQLFNHEDIPSN